MIEHSPVRFASSPETLRALEASINGFSRSGETPQIIVAWFTRNDAEPFMVGSSSVDLADKFEVFTLGIEPVSQAIENAKIRQPAVEKFHGELREAGFPLPTTSAVDPTLFQPKSVQPWPFLAWQVEVVWRREWIALPDAIPSDWFSENGMRRCVPGELPPGTSNAAWVATGILFSDIDGHRLLLSQGQMPLDLALTQADEAIDHHLADCLTEPLADYLLGCATNTAPSF
jgi:hypothetical protein